MNQININRLKQVIVEETYSRRNVRDRVRTEVLSEIDSDMAKVYNKAIDALVLWTKSDSEYDSLILRKNHLKLLDINEIVIELFIAVTLETSAKPIQVFIHRIAEHLEHNDRWFRAKLAGELIVACVDCGLYDIIKGSQGEYISLDPLFQLDAATRQYIDSTQYLPPMLVKPERWTSNTRGGYITVGQSVILGKRDTHHEEKQCYDALNIAQSVELELDVYMLTFEEEPNKPLDTPEKKQAFKQMTDESKGIYEYLIENGNTWYLHYRYDYRGRMYSQGYHVNIQSSSYKKSLINFTKRQLITG